MESRAVSTFHNLAVGKNAQLVKSRIIIQELAIASIISARARKPKRCMEFVCGRIADIILARARLRRDLATREFEDLKQDKIISTHQFKQRVAQLLQSYNLKGLGEEYSLEKLVRGMPAGLFKCKKNKYGPSGK